jgi:RHS repeat-associated protein
VVVKSYTIGHDVFLEAVAANQARRLLKDGHGSTRALVDALGNLIQSGTTPQIYAYDAYGNPLGFSPALALTTHLYSGEQTDQLTGLQYLRARYYNPATGTFNRLDPFAGNFSDPQSLHKYLYTHGDPVGSADPTGLWSMPNVLTTLAIGTGVLGGLYLGNVAGLIPTPQNKPGFGESLIPFWGSGKAFLYNVNNGNYWQAALDGAFFVSDFFLIRSLANGLGKVGFREFFSPGGVRAVWGRSVSGSNHFYWQVDNTVYHALEDGGAGMLRVIGERVGPDAVYNSWPKMLGFWVPVLSKNAAKVCGRSRTCLFAMLQALDAAGAPVIFQTIFKVVHNL